MYASITQLQDCLVYDKYILRPKQNLDTHNLLIVYKYKKLTKLLNYKILVQINEIKFEMYILVILLSKTETDLLYKVAGP